MADEAASTTTSEQTATEATAATTEAAATAAAAAAEAGKTEATGADTSTALGSAGAREGKTDAEKAAGTTTENNEGEAAAGKGEVPETYELALPEGFEKLDEKAVEAATPVFKELGLSNEQANKLMPVAGEFAKSIIADRDQQFLGVIMEQRKTWLNDAKADQEIGGAKWDESIASSARAMDRLGFPKGSPLRAALDESGFGNHPEMVRLLARAGKAIGEDTEFVRGDTAAAVKPKTAEETFWPGQSTRQA